MAINGRINVDVLFHDTDGTTSLKVVSLEDSTEYTSGKVAIVTGTCGTTGVSISPSSPGYVNSAGETVTFSNVVRLALKSPEGVYVRQGFTEFIRSRGDVSVGNVDQVTTASPYSVVAFTGTASYTMVLYGT